MQDVDGIHLRDMGEKEIHDRVEGRGNVVDDISVFTDNITQAAFRQLSRKPGIQIALKTEATTAIDGEIERKGDILLGVWVWNRGRWLGNRIVSEQQSYKFFALCFCQWAVILPDTGTKIESPKETSISEIEKIARCNRPRKPPDNWFDTYVKWKSLRAWPQGSRIEKRPARRSPQAMKPRVGDVEENKIPWADR